jgi:tartrate/fumarate subfamily iron-sulfur-dependent hydro-lyase beta chain
MSDTIRHLQLPLSEDVARDLALGSLVTVSGLVFTGRSRFHIRAIEQGIVPPIDFRAVNCFFHVGPVVRREDAEWKIVSIEPTSSIRFERYGADVVRKLKLRTLIGKTTMGPKTAEALCEAGGVYLTKLGICGNQLAAQVERIHGVHFLDELGKTEATWIFEVQQFGPFFVAIDAHGNNYFERLHADTLSRIESILRDLGIPDDFDYTEVNPSVQFQPGMKHD